MNQEIKPLNILLKGLLLFLIFNLAFAAWQPRLGYASLYNAVFPGRERLPFGENPEQSYNLSLFDLDAMFASHVIAGEEKAEDEYRVIVIGDSSVWGTLLKPEETIVGQLNAANLSVCGKNVRVYNLGYPTISLTKDVMLLSYGMEYNPDLVIWMTTLEAFPIEKQTASPLAANNEETLHSLAGNYQLKVEANDSAVQKSFWGNTILGNRRALADLIRLQMYGMMWAATGIDQFYPVEYERAQTDFETDESFHDFQPPTLDENQVALNALETGFRVADDTPMILVNEPMLISAGTNSDIRYNFFYPRWAYDQYREMMFAISEQNGWNYIDLWDAVPADEFTNSAIHLTSAGEKLLAENIAPYIIEACK